MSLKYYGEKSCDKYRDSLGNNAIVQILTYIIVHIVIIVRSCKFVIAIYYRAMCAHLSSVYDYLL